MWTTKTKFYLSVILFSAIIIVASIISLFQNSKEFTFLKSAGEVKQIYASSRLAEQQKVECRSKVTSVTNHFKEYLSSLKTIVIHDNEDLRRGLANANIIYIRCLQDIEEFENVLIHEIGHVIDLGHLKGKYGIESGYYDFSEPILTDDPSISYYSISWINNDKIKQQNETSFVSKYAMTNPFEDFAETFLVFIKYKNILEDLKATNTHLARKFNFMNEHFKQLVLSENNYILDNSTPFDATKIYHNFIH